MFALMDRKSQPLYAAIYERCVELCPDFSPVTVIADYEAANYLALEQVFPGVQFSGCYFHYAQAIIRKMRKVNLCSIHPSIDRQTPQTMTIH